MRHRLHGEAVRGLLFLAVLAPAAWAQGRGTLAPQLFGPKSVLVRYRDKECKKELSGQGSTQAWTRVVGAGSCYELTTGMLCPFRCIIKLGCAFETGSGVQFDEFPDRSCQGPPQAVKPFAQHLYWLEALDLFKGGCQADGSGSFVKFRSPLDDAYYPNCERFGAVAPGGDMIAYLYESLYTLQFYSDLKCEVEYQVTAFSDRPTSRFSWRLFRGAQYCYDMVDDTPREEGTPPTTKYNIMNWRMVCGNSDSLGNGIMIKGYLSPKCDNMGRSMRPEQWKNVFYPMNYPSTMDLLNGRCTLWGKYRVKFDRPFSKEHYPDCKKWACSDGPCTGGRIRSPNETAGEIYGGGIRTSGGNPADARSLDPNVVMSKNSGTIVASGTRQLLGTAVLPATIATSWIVCWLGM